MAARAETGRRRYKKLTPQESLTALAAVWVLINSSHEPILFVAMSIPASPTVVAHQESMYAHCSDIGCSGIVIRVWWR